MPSSLTGDHPSALAVSCQPTGVGLRYGRQRPSRRGFSRRCGLAHSELRRVLAPPLTPRPRSRRGRATSGDRPCPLGRPRYPPGSPHALSLMRRAGGAGMWTCSPSPTPRGLGLGPTNPERIILPQEPSGLRRRRFSRRFSLLIPASALASPPRVLPLALPRRRRRSPTIPPPPPRLGEPTRAGERSMASVAGLILDTLSAPPDSTSELLRTLSRVAASEPTSWLSRPRDRLANLARTWRP